MSSRSVKLASQDSGFNYVRVNQNHNYRESSELPSRDALVRTTNLRSAPVTRGKDNIVMREWLDCERLTMLTTTIWFHLVRSQHSMIEVKNLLRQPEGSKVGVSNRKNNVLTKVFRLKDQQQQQSF